MNGENDFPGTPPLFITQGKTLFFCSLAVRMISRDAILYHLDDKREFFALLWDCLGAMVTLSHDILFQGNP